MVGTRRTNACDTCRRRRVKCDEVRPVCGPCAIKGRACSVTPIPKVTWVKDGQLTSGENASESIPDEYWASVGKARNSLRLLGTTAAASGGGIIHKLRFDSARPRTVGPRHSSRVPNTPILTAVEKLRISFVTAYLHGPPGFRLSGFSHQFADLPRYLGESRALDYASACLVDAHAHRARGQIWSGNTTYLKALRSLQDDLNSPSDACRSTTMCAIALLSWTEILGETMDVAYVQHVGGLAGLMRVLGPACVQDDLATNVVLSAIGGIIVDAILKNQPCLMNEPQWSWMLRGDAKHTKKQEFFTRIMSHFSRIAYLVVAVRSACGQNGSVADAQQLLEEATELRDTISKTNAEMDRSLKAEGVETRRLRQAIEGAPISSIYWFKQPSTARQANIAWSLSIYINNIITRLMSFLEQSDDGLDQSEISSQLLDLDSKYVGVRILMSTAYVAQFAPVGSAYMRLPMYMAWGTLDPSSRAWAVNELHKLNSGLVANYHTPAHLDWSTRFLCGWDTQLPGI